MGKFDKPGEIEGTGAALDRVDGAEHGIEAVSVALALLDSHKLLFKLTQKLGAFIEVCRLEVVEVAHCPPAGLAPQFLNAQPDE